MTTVMIDYTNHAGVRAIREIAPIERPLLFGSTQWHPEPQWLLEAFDVAKNELRTFAVKDIHAWAPKDTATGRSMASFAKQLQLSIERNARMVTRLKGKFLRDLDIDAPVYAEQIRQILNDEDPT